MSAVVRRLSDNNFFIYVKGADSAVLPKIAPSSNEEMIDLENEIESLASQGKRVIIHAMRHLDDNEVATAAQRESLSRLEFNLTFIGLSTSSD